MESVFIVISCNLFSLLWSSPSLSILLRAEDGGFADVEAVVDEVIAMSLWVSVRHHCGSETVMVVRRPLALSVLVS